MVQAVWGLFQAPCIRRTTKRTSRLDRQRGYKGDVSKALQFLVMFHWGSSPLPHSGHHFLPNVLFRGFQRGSFAGLWARWLDEREGMPGPGWPGRLSEDHTICLLFPVSARESTGFGKRTIPYQPSILQISIKALACTCQALCWALGDLVVSRAVTVPESSQPGRGDGLVKQPSPLGRYGGGCHCPAVGPGAGRLRSLRIIFIICEW